jgi:putative DNA primase/helicase
MLIPWTVTFDDDRKDPKLLEKLLAELPGVLTWIVEGAYRWAQGGLQAPAEVKAAVAEYRGAEDLVGRWLTERTERVADATTSATELYEDFVAHCRAIGEKDPPSQTSFGRRLDEFGFCKVPKSKYVKRVGLRIVPDEGFDVSFE